VLWLALGIPVATALVCAALSLWAWQQSGQIQALEVSLATLQDEHLTTEAELSDSQDGVTALENRLTALEAHNPEQQLTALRSAMETASTPEQLASLQSALADVQGEVDGFQAVLDDLAQRLKNLEAAGSEVTQDEPAEVRLSVARQKQSHNLSCESSAASMAAQYHGVALSEAEVLAALPRDDNPHVGFRGNVDGEPGSIQDYGVYAEPLVDVLNERGLRARSVLGGLDGIREAIAKGSPVIAWVTYNCQPGKPTTTVIDGVEVTLVPYQHAVVVTGYSSEGVWANDPLDGQEDFYPVTDFVRAMSYFGDMAVEVAAP
jgi:uncharacterized protein YvpB